MKNAFAEYSRQVKDGSFPDQAHSFGMDEEVLKKLY